MKFTQNEAAKKISGILTRGGKDLQMSERSINENLDSLMKLMVTDETELDDFIAKVKPMFETMNANAKKDYSDFVNKWKEEHPDTNPPTDPEPPKPTESPEMKALMERIAALEKDKEESNLRASIAQKRTDLTAKLKEKGVKDEKWLDKYLSKVNINADTDVDAEVEDTLSLYNLNKANGGNPVPPANPNGGAQNESRYSSAIKAAAELAKSNREAGIVITE